MKILALLAAGLIAVGAIPVATPSAEARDVRVVERTRVVHTARGDDRDRRWNGNRNRSRWGTRTVCKTKWRNHRRVQVCNRVRYRR